MKNKILMIGIVGAAVFFTGCQKDPLKNLTDNEAKIYITSYDSTISFSRFKTFSVADSVGVIEDNVGLGKSKNDFDAKIIAAVKTAMQSRGFQLVDRTASPDLGITVSRIYNNYTQLINYPGYWDSYGGFYDPYYWGYGGYSYYDPVYYGPNYYSSYQITQGALSIDILDLKDAATDNKIHPVWSALSRGPGIFNSATVDEQLKVFFDQSPYLVTTQ